jgi:hypothetical protein
MAVYRFTTNSGVLSSVEVLCDVSHASNGLPAVAAFTAQSSSNYVILLERYGPTGTVQLNCKMGVAPPLNNPVQNCLVAGGGSITLSMPATNWCPLPVCQWRFNGMDLPGETGPTLLVKDFNVGKVGTYSVWMSNFVGTATRDVAYLALAGPFILDRRWTTNGTDVGFVINASNSTPFVLEASTNLNGTWFPVATNPDPCLILLYTNLGALTYPQRYFRAGPWPPIGP